MKKLYPLALAVMVAALAVTQILAEDSFMGRESGTFTGGVAAFTNGRATVGIASAMISGTFAAGNTGTIEVVSGSFTNVLVKGAALETVLWSDQGGAIELRFGDIVRFELTDTASTNGWILSTYQR